MEQRKYISILGDDRSTFEGVTPKIGSFYSPSYVSYAGFATPEGTWWMQLIHRLGGQLLVNNSFAGSHISCAGNYAACEAPIKVAMFTASGPGVDSDTAIKLRNSLSVSQPCPSTVSRTSEIMP